MRDPLHWLVPGDRSGDVPDGSAPSSLTAWAQEVLTGDCTVLDYQAGTLRQLVPSPFTQSGCLELRARETTAAEWERTLGVAFDPAVAQALTVLWFWWGVHELGQRAHWLRLAADQGRFPDPASSRASLAAAAGLTLESRAHPEFRDLWQNAAIFAAMFVANPAFGLTDVGASRQVARRGREHDARMLGYWFEMLPAAAMRVLLGQTAEWARGAADAMAGEGLRARSIFAEERTLAADMVTVDCRSKTHLVTCGKLGLLRLALAEDVRRMVEKQLQVTPESKPLDRLRWALSPYHTILHLIDSGLHVPALQAIEELPGGQRRLPDVCDLESRCRAALASQTMAGGDAESSLEHAAKAMSLCTDQAQRRALDHAVGALCLKHAEQLAQQGPDLAISFLERASRLTGIRALDPALGRLLAARGLERLRQGERRLVRSTGKPEDKIHTLRQAMAEVERGMLLGAERAVYEPPLERAVQFLEEAEWGFLGLSERWQRQLVDAYTAGRHGHFDKAIAILRRILDTDHAELSNSVLRRKLAEYLFQRADSQAAMCAGVLGLDGGRATASGRRLPGAEDVGSLLTAALQDLAEAVRLDGLMARKAQKLESRIRDWLRRGVLSRTMVLPCGDMAPALVPATSGGCAVQQWFRGLSLMSLCAVLAVIVCSGASWWICVVVPLLLAVVLVYRYCA